MANEPQDRLITVSAARQDGRVALWERHPDHPGGEVFVAAGGGPVQAACTPAVLRALAEGALVEQPRPQPAPEPPAVIAETAAQEVAAAPGRRKAARGAAGEQQA